MNDTAAVSETQDCRPRKIQVQLAGNTVVVESGLDSPVLLYAIECLMQPNVHMRRNQWFRFNVN